MKRVSVIINSYQGDLEHLSESIKSIQQQKKVKTQVVVSTVKGDDAINVANTLGAEVVINQKAGIYSQLNNALPKINGEWFFYFSGNDVAGRNKSIMEIATCLKYKKKICYSAFFSSNESLKRQKRMEFRDYDLKQHYIGNYVSDVAMMHRSIIDKYAPFNEGLENAAYWDFWLRVAEQEGNVFVYNKIPTWFYRISDQSRHIQRKSDPVKIIDNLECKLRMIKAHRSYLKKHSLLYLIKQYEKEITHLRNQINTGNVK